MSKTRNDISKKKQSNCLFIFHDAKTKIISWLEEKELGEKAIQYKLRDWLFSRQRYWGEPIPIIHKDGKTIPLDESELPLELPNVEKYEPSELD